MSGISPPSSKAKRPSWKTASVCARAFKGATNSTASNIHPNMRIVASSPSHGGYLDREVVIHFGLHRSNTHRLDRSNQGRSVTGVVYAGSSHLANLFRPGSSVQVLAH